MVARNAIRRRRASSLSSASRAILSQSVCWRCDSARCATVRVASSAIRPHSAALIRNSEPAIGGFCSTDDGESELNRSLLITGGSATPLSYRRLARKRFRGPQDNGIARIFRQWGQSHLREQGFAQTVNFDCHGSGPSKSQQPQRAQSSKDKAPLWGATV